MTPQNRLFAACATALLMAVGLAVIAQSDRARSGPPVDRFRGPVGGPPFMNQDLAVLEKFDKNNDGLLDAGERKPAREFIREERSNRPAPRFGRRNENLEPPEPGQQVSPAEVKKFDKEPFYSTDGVRTLFLEFENPDWEKELSDFHNTDVEVPAILSVDGKIYKDVGVHFRGMSSYMGVPEGRKRSLNLSVDFVRKNQNIGGYRTLNLLNAHEDPTYLRPVLFYEIAREYIPAPKANFVRLVINGEDWGIYNNVQQFNKDFVREWFGTTKGARWKVRGSPRGRGSLAYLGPDPEEYKKIYTIKSKDDAKSWKALIELCRVLNETEPENLVQELSPILNIDGALKFLALDNALINNDGYWIRTSDYSIYQDTSGKFHIIPQDANETFAQPGAMGVRFMPPGAKVAPEDLQGDLTRLLQPPFRGPDPFAGPPDGPRPIGPGPEIRRMPGPGRNMPPVDGVKLDPLVAAKDVNKPLASKLLAVPELREKYLRYVRDIAEKHLDWKALGPRAQKYHAMLDPFVKIDTRKLDSYDAFQKALTEDLTGSAPFGRIPISLKNFAEQRREYLLNYKPTE